MGDLRFVWDPAKAAANKRKHGVSFDEAQSIFADENGLFLSDPDHSEHEDRFLLLGLSVRLRILAVIHTVSRDGDIIRVISARKATNREEQQYLDRVM
jgi:uncharacterized DUF497 family protein